MNQFYRHYHDYDDIDSDKERKLLLQLMFLNIYFKKFAPETKKNTMKKEIKKIKDMFFPIKNGPFVSKETLKQLDLFDVSTTLLLFLELYVKGVKCVIIEGNDLTQIKTFSMLGNLSEEDLSKIVKNKEDKKTFSMNQPHIQVLENYDPTTIYYFTENENSTFDYVTKKRLVEMNEDEKNAMVQSFQLKDHEFISPNQCVSIQNLV